jgi:hypothetical protein
VEIVESSKNFNEAAFFYGFGRNLALQFSQDTSRSAFFENVKSGCGGLRDYQNPMTASIDSRARCAGRVKRANGRRPPSDRDREQEAF